KLPASLTGPAGGVRTGRSPADPTPEENLVVLLFERNSWPKHRPWWYFFLGCLVAATAFFFGFTYANNLPAWPAGSSLPGLAFGVLGGLIILFEMLLWFRKKVRVWRV